MEDKITETGKRPKMAICYDFDKTLSPDDMQSFTLIPSFGIEKETFWKESNQLAKENLMDRNLAWMYELLRYSTFKGKPFSKDYLRSIGAEVQLYKGVESWFDRISKYAAGKGLELEHYIISSGLKEIIEGSKIANKFKRIYASSYYYNTDGAAIWPAQAINYTYKTQYIFRIAKGIPEEWDDRVNDSMRAADLVIPYENIVYIGDSETDIPCMRLVKSKGGYAIGVFDPQKNSRKKVYQLYNDERINFYAPADYSARSSLFHYLKEIIDEIAVREQMKADREVLSGNAKRYQMFLEAQQAFSGVKLTKKQREEVEKYLAMLKESIEGNID